MARRHILRRLLPADPRSRTLAFLVAIVLASSGCRGVDQVTGRVGEPVLAGDYRLVAASMENPAERPDRFTNPKPGNRFVKFEVTMSNRGQQHLPLAAGYFTMVDSGGVENAAMPGIPSDRGIRLTSLNPGGEISFPLYFEMAGNLAPRELVFAPRVVGWSTRITLELGR